MDLPVGNRINKQLSSSSRNWPFTLLLPGAFLGPCNSLEQQLQNLAGPEQHTYVAGCFQCLPIFTTALLACTGVEV
jgi:hypothetical protein